MRTSTAYPTPPRHPLHNLLAVIAILGLALPASANDPTEFSPWVLLEKLRDGMQSSGPMTSQFTQTYIPAGFSDGDREQGHMSMWLPDCLRWNYEAPQKKNFLVCQSEVYHWSEDEPGGRRYRIDPRGEPGMDLLLVPVSALRQRYVASSEAQKDGSYVISLATPPSEGGNFSARIQIDRDKSRVQRLEYTDDEGNLTRFQLTNYKQLSHTALFQPPDDIEWTEE